MKRVFSALALVFATSTAWSAELLMVEEVGCRWCAEWNRVIGPIYPKTAEGAAAPLRRIDIGVMPPPDVAMAGPVVFTPTFVLIDAGREVSRIEGYPGEDFFWGLLGQMIENAGIDINQAD